MTPVRATRPADDAPHIPVMLEEVIDSLAVRAGGLYVDGTFGAGGYSEALLRQAECRVWGIDRDPAAVERAAPLEARHAGRFTLLSGCFGAMEQLLATVGVTQVDGVVLDLGVSSMQLDEPERGFSFRFDGPLDMRMSSRGPSAADLVNTLEEGPLADVLFYLGEERAARRVARAVVERRREQPFTRTADLAAVVRAVVRKSGDGIDPATRTFQALRLAVNDELGELARGLAAAERLLAPGGRLVVVSFHSLEDRVVKAFLRERAGERAGVSRHRPDVGELGPAATFRALSRRPRVPGATETARNPRSRSARLRAGERTAAPAWPHAPLPGLPPASVAGFSPFGASSSEAHSPFGASPEAHSPFGASSSEAHSPFGASPEARAGDDE